MESWNEIYTGRQVEVRLAPRRSAVYLELTFRGWRGAARGEVTVEFLLQGQDRLGLALGPATRVHLERIAVHRPDGADAARGSAWLSSPLDVALLRRCHLRVWPSADQEVATAPRAGPPSPRPLAES